MDIDELRSELSLNLSDPGKDQVNDTALLRFINQAARDARVAGWLLPLNEDESLTLTTGTYEYNVPASFSHIVELRHETTAATDLFDYLVLPHEWELAYDGAVPIIRYLPAFLAPVTGIDVQVIGFQRPTQTYASGSTTVDLGMESFLRERSLSYALSYAAVGVSEYATRRAQRADVALGLSQNVLETRLRILLLQWDHRTREVPGRE